VLATKARDLLCAACIFAHRALPAAPINIDDLLLTADLLGKHRPVTSWAIQELQGRADNPLTMRLELGRAAALRAGLTA